MSFWDWFRRKPRDVPMSPEIAALQVKSDATNKRVNGLLAGRKEDKTAIEVLDAQVQAHVKNGARHSGSRH